MGDRLSGGNAAVALLANSLATGAVLVVLITVLGPISGAHLNPAVSIVERARRVISGRELVGYLLAQLAGAICGVLVAHAMFSLPLVTPSTQARTGPAQWCSEVVATFGLLLTVLGGSKHHPDRVPVLVGLYILAAYWFTASTSFANPAVTIARALTDTFAGIRPIDVVPFVGAQLAGSFLAVLVWRVLDPPGDSRT